MSKCVGFTTAVSPCRPARYRGRAYTIEPDATAASYFFAAAAITGGQVTVEGLSKNSIQGDIAFCDCLEKMGCRVEYRQRTITVTGGAARHRDRHERHQRYRANPGRRRPLCRRTDDHPRRRAYPAQGNRHLAPWPKSCASSAPRWKISKTGSGSRPANCTPPASPPTTTTAWQ